MNRVIKWEHIGDGWHRLKERYCYAQTNVFIVPLKGRYGIRLVNPHDEPQGDNEIARKRGQVDSVKTWKTPGGAKRVAYSVVRRTDWLEMAGIKFKEGAIR